MRRGVGRAGIPLLLPCMLLAGCGDGGGRDETMRRDEEPSVVATKSDADLPDWLSPTDPMETGRWLASREAGRVVAKDDAASAQMRRSLGQAQGYFIEDTRMIANRTVQLGQMLGGAGKKETYESLIDGLTRVAQGARGRQLYGEMCQHYYNTRQQGSGRAQALQTLAERYGAQNDGRPRDHAQPNSFDPAGGGQR